MPSDLERAIAEQRRRILAKDRATLVQLMGAYNESLTRLKPMIELVQIAVNDAGLTSPAKIFQLERYKILEDQLRAEMQRLAMQTGMAIRGGEAEAIDLGQRAALELVSASARDAVTVTASFASVPFEAVREATGVLAPDSPAGKLLDSFGDAAGQRLRQEIINAMALGKNPRAIANAMASAAGISRNRALLIARTETLRAYRTAALQRYAANSDILDGWLWTCAKQTRTCAACLAMDGTLHPLSDQFMKAHPACRCSPRPKLKPEYAMPRDPVESGSEWLARQDADVQDGILGKQGGDAYRNGDVILSDFVRVRTSEQWGDSTTDGGIGWARKQAERRQRRKAA